MRLVLAAPLRPSRRSGNDVTAARWARRLRELGHDADVVSIADSAPLGTRATQALGRADAALVLHARRSAPAARWWRARRGPAPMVVALTGTDLYVDLPDDPDARWTLTAADHVITLQRAACERVAAIAPDQANRCTVVHQSVDLDLPARSPVDDEVRVVVLAHARAVKDPLMAARAARLVPASSTIRIHHAGDVTDARWRSLVEAEQRTNPRYVWHGGLERTAAMELLASATVLACTSTSEGGANVVTEAIALGVPVVGTRIDGNTGLLGDDHPGLVEVGDDAELARLLTAVETEAGVLDALQARVDALAPVVTPQAERDALAGVLGALGIT